MDRWGPGTVAAITLICVLWYGRYLEGLIEILRGERAAVEARLERHPSRDEYEARLREMERQIAALQEVVNFEAAKTQSLRERLIKEGWIE